MKFALEERPQAEAEPQARPAAAEPNGTKDAPARKRNLAEDPIVKKTSELFGGEVFDIRE